MIDYHSAVIKKRMSEYLMSSDFDPYFERLHLNNAGLWAMGLIAPLTIVGLPLAKAAWKKILAGDGRTKRLRKRYARLAERGEVIFTYVVVANSTLKYQEDSNAPVLVVGNFDDGKSDLEIMKLRDKFADAALGLSSEPGESDLVKLLGDLDYTFKKRRIIPRKHTGGIDVTAFDLQVTGEYLPTRKL
tara:strand:+ start:1843 stop:2406 length:564 start_codon:yes stop_codon:yes gene_type:complete